MDNYLGFDMSTQSLKGMIIDSELNVLHEEFVNYDSDIPEYRTHLGVERHTDGSVTVDSSMFVKALDIILERFKTNGVQLSKVVAISGAAQQAGCVYWKEGSENILGKMDPKETLHKQLSSSFALQNPSIWMDTTTEAQCQMLEKAVGGPEVLRKITGCKAFSRYSGPHIAKVYENYREKFHNTERISVISSFFCSLFLGRYAPIDFADGSAMNLLDIRNKDWNDSCLDACATNLRTLLGKPEETTKVLGKISQYFVKRYSFNPECSIVSFTGDNPASLVGTFMTPNDFTITFGTADVMLMWLQRPIEYIEGLVNINPLNPNEYTGLLGFGNGSCARVSLRNKYCQNSWETFNQYLNRVPAGSYGNIGIYNETDEGTPHIGNGTWFYDEQNNLIKSLGSDDVLVRAAVEGQILSRRIHAENFIDFSILTRVLVTGGASLNKSFLQILSDVFNVPVYTMKVSNSACLGAAVIAKVAHSRSTFPDDVLPKYECICYPDQNANEVYMNLLDRYRGIEKNLVRKFKLVAS